MAEDWFYYNTRVCSTARSSLLQKFVSFDSGYKRVSPVTNAVVPTTIPFTSELFSRCRCAMNRKPLATSLSKIIPSICRIYRSDIFAVQYVSSRFKRVRDISILSLSPSLLLYTFDSYGFVSLFFFFFFQLRNLNTTIETKRGNILEFSSFQVFHPIDRVIHLLHFFFSSSQREKSRRRKKITETLFLRSPLTFHSNSSV